MNHRTHGLMLTLNALEEEYMKLGHELYGLRDALHQNASLVTLKVALEDTAKQASRVHALASAEGGSLADYLNRNARVA